MWPGDEARSKFSRDYRELAAKSPRVQYLHVRTRAEAGTMMERCSFSGGGEYLAVGQLEGEVKIWDALTGALKQPGAASNGVIRSSLL